MKSDKIFQKMRLIDSVTRVVFDFYVTRISKFKYLFTLFRFWNYFVAINENSFFCRIYMKTLIFLPRL